MLGSLMTESVAAGGEAYSTETAWVGSLAVDGDGAVVEGRGVAQYDRSDWCGAVTDRMCCRDEER
jgi:hypothetical protein